MRQIVYNKIKGRLSISFDLFLLATKDYEFIPFYRKDKLKAIVMKKDNEVHIIALSDLKGIRSFMKEILNSVVNEFGEVVTKVNNEYSIGHKLANLLGFEQEDKNNFVTTYKLRSKNVWCS